MFWGLEEGWLKRFRRKSAAPQGFLDFLARSLERSTFCWLSLRFRVLGFRVWGLFVGYRYPKVMSIQLLFSSENPVL